MKGFLLTISVVLAGVSGSILFHHGQNFAKNQVKQATVSELSELQQDYSLANSGILLAKFEGSKGPRPR